LLHIFLKDLHHSRIFFLEERRSKATVTFSPLFKALTGGVFYLNSSWSFADFAVLFWTSTPWGNYKALSHGMNTINFSVSPYPASRANAFPMRCVKDP
jgi:hypothetical protein